LWPALETKSIPADNSTLSPGSILLEGFFAKRPLTLILPDVIRALA
jgi:hypothetical protein